MKACLITEMCTCGHERRFHEDDFNQTDQKRGLMNMGRWGALKCDRYPCQCPYFVCRECKETVRE